MKSFQSHGFTWKLEASHIPVNLGRTESLNDSNTQQYSSTSEVKKEGAERWFGGEGNKFCERSAGKAYYDPELFLYCSTTMSASVTEKIFVWWLLPPVPYGGTKIPGDKNCLGNKPEIVLSRRSMWTTGQWGCRYLFTKCPECLHCCTQGCHMQTWAHVDGALEGCAVHTLCNCMTNPDAQKGWGKRHKKSHI